MPRSGTRAWGTGWCRRMSPAGTRRCQRRTAATRGDSEAGHPDPVGPVDGFRAEKNRLGQVIHAGDGAAEQDLRDRAAEIAGDPGVVLRVDGQVNAFDTTSPCARPKRHHPSLGKGGSAPYRARFVVLDQAGQRIRPDGASNDTCLEAAVAQAASYHLEPDSVPDHAIGQAGRPRLPRRPRPGRPPVVAPA